MKYAIELRNGEWQKPMTLDEFAHEVGANFPAALRDFVEGKPHLARPSSQWFLVELPA